MPSAFPGDRPITRELLAEHKVSADEYERAKGALGREPTYTELGVISVMWSEHCSYKSSRVHLKRLPTKGPKVVVGPGENAGAVDIGDGYCAVFKMESHNHPSFIEPHQGAATGVGGILRDVFTMGARPIASLNSLRFGKPSHPRTPDLVRGVSAGIGGYGNAIGVPTVGGETQFDEAYDGNILVNAFTCGVAKKDGLFFGRATGTGNPILYIGAKTGRDGIHGATMASDEFGAGKEGKGELATASSIKKGERSTIQVGDPFLGKLLLEACLELFQNDALEGIQDMGAAGLTSSSVEMAGRAGSGVEIDLDLIPRRAKKMLPYEILLSESQERMLLVAKKGREQEVLDVCTRWELDAAVIGHVTETGRWVVKATPNYCPLDDAPIARSSIVVCDLPTDALTDKAPVYDRPRAPFKTRATESFDKVVTDHRGALLSLLSSANIGDKGGIFRQYDQIVRGGTLVRPGGDAAVVRVPCDVPAESGDHFKYLAFAVDCNGRMCELDPEMGAKMAIAEVCRNLVVTGAEPLGITDCLNFANPERPEVMESFALAVDGMAAACNALEVPIVSGNVSLYNETTLPDGKGKVAIFPTPSVAAVGQLRSASDVVRPWFRREGDVIMLLGRHDDGRGMGGSELACMLHGKLVGPAPTIDLAEEVSLQKLVLGLSRAQVLQSAHDVSDGGLAAALAECVATGPEHEQAFGAVIDDAALLPGAQRTACLFGEAPSRVIISVGKDVAARVEADAKAAGVACLRLGVTASGPLTMGGFQVTTQEIRDARQKGLAFIFG
jgi:phosphoribosylformylglycinamidine synthase